MNHSSNILNILRKQDKNGNIVARESSEIEFKESFNLSNMPEYSKCMAAFANRTGGYIIFGVKNNPRRLVGIDISKFNEIPQERVTNFLLDHFHPEVKWEVGFVEYENIYIGYIYTYEAEIKPVICRKNKDDELKNGSIYYRYRAQSKNIEYGELKKIIDEIKESERKNWVKLFRDITKIGPENAVISHKSPLGIRPSSDPKALSVKIDEEDITKIYPLDYKKLTEELKNRYVNFKENQDYHKIRKELKIQKRYCFTRTLDPNNPKSPKKDFYSKEIINEFDKYYHLISIIRKNNHEP